MVVARRGEGNRKGRGRNGSCWLLGIGGMVKGRGRKLEGNGKETERTGEGRGKKGAGKGKERGRNGERKGGGMAVKGHERGEIWGGEGATFSATSLVPQV